MTLTQQAAYLFLLALPVACAAWTVTHEQIFLETRNFCKMKSEKGRSLLERKFYYLFTCEYCFSHYVAAFFVIITGFKFLTNDWSGYLIAGLALVWISNLYMTIFGILRQMLKVERLEGNLKDNRWQEVKEEKDIS